MQNLIVFLLSYQIFDILSKAIRLSDVTKRYLDALQVLYFISKITYHPGLLYRD